MAVERDIIYFADENDWSGWLAVNGTDSPGVQIAIARKGSALPSVTYAEAVETALCFGWIDGRRTGLDETHYLQLFTPRRTRSIWSQINTERATTLIKSGRMMPAGLAEVERAKADGRWQAAYAPASTIQVPDDLTVALAAAPEATAVFENLDSTNRYAILFRIANVKRAETRARKIAEYVGMLGRGETIYPRKP
ncbi:YdeI/OmpD-associated family protein [Glaciibacter psychrotolerans]|uniref:Uncharacterized protein YdeI (YjbR/CyaY-like superfamily) n=1 Tax=Glaciibacter psychrotolerans TaxID=670054 RepID=A0A7Z0EH47_9MICO|nr:YdeI/OmpD-associated family protein [Leifsonia psychrotolerans]NYJ21403.1 uncharacterized protein YdeI (YjbR/CyaY-like superfamily) [Leifsonia psychrotolerans]